MKQKLKKSLSLLLAMVMLLGMLPSAAFARETLDDPNQVVEGTNGDSNGNNESDGAFAWSLTLTAGMGMTGTNLEQKGDKDVSITPVVLTAEEGYTFPEDYAASTLEAVGLTVLRDSETQVTISGSLTANVTMALPDAAAAEGEPEGEPLDTLALAEPRAANEKTYSVNTSVASLAEFTKVTVEAGVTVTLTGTTTLTQDVVITGDGTLKRGTGCTGDMFYVAADKTLTMNGSLTLDGASILAKGSAVRVENKGTFVMEDGTIQNFRSNKDPGGAAVYIAGNNDATPANNGTFNMTGGTIKDNRFENKTIGVGGGAIAVLGNFTMTSGLISNNYSATNGGAIGLLGNNLGGRYASVVIKGDAQIVGNTARRWGGAIEAMGNRDCGGGAPEATLTIDETAVITGNLSGYQNDRANDGFGGGVETSDMQFADSVKIGGSVIISGNNHWTSGSYSQDNLYCGTSSKTGWPVLNGDFTGSVGVSPSGSGGENTIFGNVSSKTAPKGSFFYDGKALVNDTDTLKWVKGEAAKTITKVTVDTDYKATVAPARAEVTYQWYVSDTSSVSGGLPIPGETTDTLSSTAQKENRGRYVYVIADGKGGYTGRATSTPMEVAPEVTPIRGDFTLYYSTADGLLHKGSLTGEALKPASKYGYDASGDKKTLILKGIDFITSKAGIEMPYNTSIELFDGTVNYIESTSRTGDDWADSGIHVGLRNGGSNNTMTIKGSGALTVKGACAAIMVHFSGLVIEGNAVVVAEGNGYPGTAARDSAGIYAMNGITVQGAANVTALGGPCAQNSYGAGSNKGGVSVKGTAVLTVAGGQTRDKSGTYRSMGISTAGVFDVKEDASVITRGDTVAADIWYTSDQGKNNLSEAQINTMFANTEIVASTQTNGSNPVAATSDYVAFANKLDWKTAGGDIYKWAHIYPEGSSSAPDILVNPTFLNASGDYSGKVTVNIASVGAEIFYTTDGTEPSKTNGAKYTTAFDIEKLGLTTVKAIAYKGNATSPVTTVTYNVLAAPKLTGLSVTGYTLSPAFTADNYGPYVVVVPGTVTKVDVIANAAASIVVKKGNDVVSKSGSAYPISLTDPTTEVTFAVGSNGNLYKLNIRKAGADDTVKKDTYEPLTITSGFNKDVVVEKSGTPSSYAEAYDGVNSAAQFAFYTKAYNASGAALPDDGKMTDPNAADKSEVRWQLADYAGKNAIQLSWDNPTATVRFETLSTYDKLSLIGSSGNADGHFRTTIHYTDGTTSTATFTAPNWSYAPGVSLQSLSRVKLLTGAGTNAGKLEHGFAMYAFEIPVTPGKLVSYLELVRTDTTTGDTAARTNIVAVSGVINKGVLVKPDKPAGGSNVTDGKFTATWDKNDSAIGYYIDVAASEDFSDMLPGYDNKQLQPGDYDDTTTPGTVKYVISGISGTVYYRIRAVGSDGKQSQSSEPAEVIGDDSGDGTAATLVLNDPVQGENQSYTFPNAIVGTSAKTIIVGFADTVNSGDWIELPSTSGFTVSSGSNDYSKRITVGAGKTAADIQDYLRQIVFHLGEDSYTNTGKQVQVTLDSKQVDNDTFYFEGTGHYYQYVPMGTKQNWMECYEAAKGMTYAGRKGYLATVTSLEEDMFIKSLSGQIGWLGGTRMVAAGDAKDTNTQYFAKTVFEGITHNAGAHASNPWIWACGPEIGTEFSYTNWNTGTGEPNGQTASGDSHECALTTLFQGSKGFSWNDRNPGAKPGVGTAGYQPYGYFVEFGDQTIGNSVADPADNTSVTGTGTITKKTSTTESGGTDSLDMTEMPEFDPANPDWKPVPGTSPADYRYEGTIPANDVTWEWVYTSDNKGTPSQDDYYSLVLKGVNITTTNRPAISLPDLPRGSLQPVRIKVQDGTENTITNLEDTDLTTNVTVIDSKRDLVIEPLGSKADGTLKLIGSNLSNSQEGVFGIVSYGKVTVSSLEMTIELTDNRATAGGSATTGIKSDTGDIVLDNPKLDIIIHDNRPFVPPATSAIPPARGLEPGYPSNNVYVNGGEVDIKFDGTPNVSKGDSTYPIYRPVYTDEYPYPTGYVPGDHPDDSLFPIQPAKPVAKAEGNNIIIYAKGSALLVVEGEDAAKTTIYHDVNRNGELDLGEEAVALEGGGTTTNIVNVTQTITLYAGANDDDAAGWPLMTIAGGKVNTIYAGGYATTKNIKLTGAPVINITGGTVEQIYDGGNNTLSKRSAITTGVVTVNISGGTVTRLDSRADAATRSESVYVNMFGVPGGKIVTLTPNAKNPINLSIEGSAKVGSLLDFNSLAGKHINVTGPLTSGTEITLEETLTAFAPGTLLAQAENPDYVKLGNFYLMDSLTRKTAKGVQVITEGATVKIASGGPTKLDNLDLGDLDIPTDSSHDGWTGPNGDGSFDYNAPDGEGWELKYDPKADDGEGRYYLTMDGLNIDTGISPALQLPNGKPTTIIVKGDNKLTVRGDEADAMVGIDAPMGVDFEGKDKTKDVLTILVNNSGTGAVTGVRSDKNITITDTTVKVLLPGSGAPAKGMEADTDNTGDGDVVIKDADVVIDIPAAAPATGITTPGDIEIIDTKPSDGKRPTIEIDIEGKDDQPSTGLEAGAPVPNPVGKGDVIIGGGEIHIDISTGKPAIGIKADDDVIIDKGEPTDPSKPGNDDGDKPNVDINIGDIKATPKKVGSPAIGIKAEDNTDDDSDPATTPKKEGGIIIGGEADIIINIPTPPGNYPAPNPADNEPNRGLDSDGDITVNDGSRLEIDMVGPGTGVKGDKDVIVEDSDVDVTIKNNPTGTPLAPTGPITGIEGDNVIIKDTNPKDKEHNVDITVGEKDKPNSGGAPSTGIKADEDVILEGPSIKIDIPTTGKPSKGIVGGDDVIVIPGDDPSKPGEGDGEKPKVDIIIGDPDDPKPTDKGPSTGIEAGDKTKNDGPADDGGKKQDGILIGGGAELDIIIPSAPGNYDPVDPDEPTEDELKETNKGLDSKGDITVNDGSRLDIDMVGPGTGIKGKDDVTIEDSDVDVIIKNDPTDPDGPGPKEPITGPIKGIESEDGDVVIKDTDPTDGKKPEIDIVIGDKDIPNSGGQPGKGIEAGDDVIIAGPDINIDIPSGKPAIGIEADDDVVIKPGDPTPDAPGKPGTPGEKPKVDIGIGDKLDPNTGGSPAIGIKADNDPTKNDPGEEDKKGVVVDNGDVNIDITVRPAPTRPLNPGPGTEPDPNQPSKGIESGGDVEFKESDVNIDIEDKTKPKKDEGPTKGIESKGDVTADDSNVDVIVTGRPGTGIEPGAPDAPGGNPDPDKKVDIKGDTNLDVDVKPGDPDYDPDNDPNTGDNPGIAGDLVIDLTPDPADPDHTPGKPNIKVDGKPGVSGDVTDPDGQPAKNPDGSDIEKDDKGNIIVTNGVTALLKVNASSTEDAPYQIKGTKDAPLAEVTGIKLTLDGEVTFVKDGIKVNDILSTNCPGVSAVVTAVKDKELTLKLTGTPTSYRGIAVAVTIPAGKIDGFKGAMKATDDTALWAIAMLDTIGREDPLGVPANPGYDPAKPIDPIGSSDPDAEDYNPDYNPKYDPDKKIEYIDENGEKKEADPNDDITDTAEGWEWYPEKPAPKPGDPGYEPGDETKYPDGYVDVDGKKYPRPVMILEDVDIKPAGPTDPGVEVPDDVTIVVPPGSDNIIEGHPAIKVGPTPGKPEEAPEIAVTGPGNLILKGVPGSHTTPSGTYPAIEGPAGKDPIILVDPDIIVNGDDHPVEKKQKKDPDTSEPMYDEDGNPIYEIETPPDNNIVFGHVNAVLNNVKKGGIPGTTNKAIADTSAKVKLENANLMPGRLTTRTVLDTNTPGVKAKVVATPGGSTFDVLLTGTPAAETSDKIMVFVPAEYVLEGAALIATSTERWNIVNPPAPNPGDGGNTPTPPGSIEAGGEDKNVDVKKEVKREDNKKIDIFTPDKEQLDEIIKDLPKGDEIVIEVKRDPDADEVIVVINGETLDEMGKKEIDLKVLDTPISINIPTKKIDITPILEELGGDAKDVDVNIRIYEPTDEEKEAIRKAIETDGSKQTDEPISFEISVSKDGKTVPVDGFDGYVTVALQITEEQAKLITTAITWQKDGSLLHIPTYVLKEGGKYYAQVNALVNCTTTLIFNEQHFVDTTGTWYDAVATELASRKIMNGVGNGKFEGGLNITRAEFAVIVVRALGLPVSETNVFDDVSADDWYAGAAGAASKYGIINGNGEGGFLPMNQITRQEAMAIIARAAKVAEYTGSTGSVSSYPDSSALADWAKEAAAMTVGSGLIKGSDGQLRPTDTITRGETAVLILRLLQKADLVDVRSAT